MKERPSCCDGEQHLAHERAIARLRVKGACILVMIKKALITGITGQDGSYLSEFLLEKGYEIHGTIRRSSSFNTARIDHLYSDWHKSDARLFLHYCNLTDGGRMREVLAQVKPDEVYNLGAQSHVRVSFDEPVYTVQLIQKSY